MNGTVFLISIFDHLFLRYKNSIDFSMLNLYSVTLSNSLIILIIFCKSLRIFYVQGHIIYALRKVLLFFSNLDAFFIQCTKVTILNRNSKDGNPCLVLITGKSTQSFPSKCDMRRKILKDALYYSFYSSFLQRSLFKLKMDVKFC